MTAVRHFLDIEGIESKTLRAIMNHAKKLKAAGKRTNDLGEKTLALIFEKPSTRTRVSFDMAMRELGGDVIALTGAEMQLGRGETLADTARVMSRYVSAMMVRTYDHGKIQEIAAAASIPVINGLTNFSHPCQAMADIMTFEEKCGPVTGKKIAWVGDGENNILTSWIHAAAKFDFHLHIAAPAEFTVPQNLLKWAAQNGAKLSVVSDPFQAVQGAEAVLTDTWVSMHNADAPRRALLLEPYRVTRALMNAATPRAIFMHCLPAHRNEEVTDEVMDGPRSAVWDEAENRKHAQKAILLWCLKGDVG